MPCLLLIPSAQQHGVLLRGPPCLKFRKVQHPSRLIEPPTWTKVLLICVQQQRRLGCRTRQVRLCVKMEETVVGKQNNC